MNETESAQAIESNDGRLKIEFHWTGDRFSQKVLLDNVAVGHSLEGNADQSWPASPPIQQLSIETIQDHAAALAVGAAGRGHWSLSGEPDPSDSSAIRFDLACRCKESADYLGSSYQLDDCLIVEPNDGEVDYSDSEPDSRQSSHRRVVIRPTHMASGTSRWSYRIAPAT